MTRSLPGYAVLTVTLLFALGPILGIVLVALQADGSFGAGTLSLDRLGLDNLGRAWIEGDFASSLGSSLIVVGVTVPVATCLSILSGYAFATMGFRGRDALFYVFLFGMMVPLEATIVPLYYLLRQFGLTDSYLALILPQIALHMPFGAFWMRSSFSVVPRELLEAARADGASTWTTLWRVYVPVARPAVLTLMSLQFMWVWNEFLLPLVMITSPDMRTAPLSISVFRGQYSDDLALVAAACLLVAMPVVLAYAFFQRNFIQGVVSGAIKE